MLCPSPRGSSGLVQALCSPDPDRGAKGTLSNAPTFPAMTRRTSKLLISETSGGEERSRNVLKSQQSLLRPGLVIEGTLAPTAVCWPACSPAGLPLSGMSMCDSGAQCGLSSLACLLHWECGVEQPPWRTAACSLSVTESQCPLALVAALWDGEEGWWMCSSNIWIFIQNTEARMSYCKGLESDPPPNVCLFVLWHENGGVTFSDFSLNASWGTSVHCCTQSTDLSSLSNSMFFNTQDPWEPMEHFLGSCESWWEQASLYIPAAILVFDVSRGGFLQTGLTAATSFGMSAGGLPLFFVSMSCEKNMTEWGFTQQ